MDTIEERLGESALWEEAFCLHCTTGAKKERESPQVCRDCGREALVDARELLGFLKEVRGEEAQGTEGG